MQSLLVIPYDQQNGPAQYPTFDRQTTTTRKYIHKTTPWKPARLERLPT
jgi:hypothetical protein